MDLRRALSDRGFLERYLGQATEELRVMASMECTHSFCEVSSGTTSDGPDGGVVSPVPTASSNPISVIELRKMQRATPKYHAVLGPPLTDAACLKKMSLWELQYYLLYIIYASPSARNDLFAAGSPKVIYDRYLRHFSTHYERHISGATLYTGPKSKTDSICMFPSSALSFTVDTMRTIYSLYNLP